MKQNDILLAIGITAVVGIGFFALKKSDSQSEFVEEIEETPISQNTPTNPTPQTPQAPSVLNVNLVLKSGSKGNEVKELQKLLGATADGDFGPKTENLLMIRKGVKSITLAQFKSKPDIPKNPLKVGNSIMANKKPEVIGYGNKTLANDVFSNTGEKFTTFDYGEKIGVIKAITNDKLHYVVEVDRPLVKNYLVWVSAVEVAKI